MAIRQYTVTLSGATRAVTAHTPCREVQVENESGNATVKFGTSAVTATDYAGSVAAAATKILGNGPSGDFPMNLDQLYFIGTDTQKIHLFVIT